MLASRGIALAMALTACSSAFGTLDIPTGAVCLSNDQGSYYLCVETAYCSSTSDWSGKCVAQAKSGVCDPSSDSCATGYYCAVPDGASSGECKSQNAKGLSCPSAGDNSCVNGTYCRESGSNAVCTADLTANSPCTNADTTATGTYCKGYDGTNPGVVTAQSGAGASCADDSNVCLDRYYCSSTSQACTAELSDRASCPRTDGDACNTQGGCYSPDTNAVNGTCVQCQSDGDCQYQHACSQLQQCVIASTVTFNVSLPKFVSDDLTPDKPGYNTFRSDIAKAAVNATSGGIVNSVDVNGAANVATTVSFTAASGAASIFESLVQKTPASVFPLDTYGNVTVTGVQLVTGSGAGMLKASMAIFGLALALLNMV